MHTGIEGTKIRKVVISTVIGGTFEWFDFLVYAYFSSTIARVYFAGIAQGSSLLLTFATFAVGFLARPIGGVLMGMYADRAGRVRALSWIMVAMSAGSLLLAFTPGYASIGLAAPLLVVAGRLVQGFAVGAQFALSSVTIFEVAPPNRKMFYGSFNMLSMGIAVMLSSGCSYLLTTHLTHDALTSWGWRVPFIIGALVGPIGFYIRHYVDESDEFHALHRATASVAQTAPKAPVARRVAIFLRENGDAIVCAMGVMIAGTSLNYVWHAYLPTYAQYQLHLSLSSSLQGVFLTSLMSCALSPLFGMLADRVGAYRLFCAFIACWSLCIFPLFVYLLAEPTQTRLLVVQFTGVFFLTLQGAAHPGMLVKIFSTRARSTGVAIAYNTAVMLFGGLAPFYISLVAKFTNASFVPPSYLLGASLLSVTLVLITPTGRRVLREDREDVRRRNGANASSQGAMESRDLTA